MPGLFPAAGDGPPYFALSRDLFLRLLGLVYLLAFASLAPQIVGLVGEDGLLPAAAYLDRAHGLWGADAYHRLPTLLWLWPGDGFLVGACWLGMALAAAVMAGIAPRALLAALWACYLGLAVAGQEFLQFQWDGLLLEAGLLAVLYAPAGRRVPFGAGAEPSAGARWLVWGLAFKLTFLSGATKLLSGDATWRGMTALEHHYQTQPLPTWVGWYAHNAPEWFGVLSVGVMFLIELAVPFAILLPARFRRVRMAGCGLLCLLQVLIAATGNYGFFNLLAVVLYLSLLDDDAIARVPRLGVSRRLRRFAVQTPGRAGRAAIGADGDVSRSAAGTPRSPRHPAPAWRRWARAGATALLAGLTVLAFVREVRRPAPAPAWVAVVLDGWIGPFRSVNGYGLFRVMTTERREIVFEGSRDGSTWVEYPFRWKPGDPARAPAFVQPHMPRLDWQMWFAALDPRGNAHWLLPIADRLLEDDPTALDLIGGTPFPDGPPRFARLVMYRYRFTNREEASGGTWWTREPLGPLTEPLSLDRPSPP